MVGQWLFHFDNAITLDQILEAADDSETGYIVEADLEFPQELHEKLRQFPPCPETMTPQLDWFSEYQRSVMQKTQSCVCEDCGETLTRTCRNGKHKKTCKKKHPDIPSDNKPKLKV